jgi:hypothetical protein
MSSEEGLTGDHADAVKLLNDVASTDDKYVQLREFE